MRSALHQCKDIFEMIVPFLNLSDTHGFVAKGLLNLPSGFHLGIAKLLSKFAAIQLLKLFYHSAVNENPRDGHYIQ